MRNIDIRNGPAWHDGLVECFEILREMKGRLSQEMDPLMNMMQIPINGH